MDRVRQPLHNRLGSRRGVAADAMRKRLATLIALNAIAFPIPSVSADGPRTLSVQVCNFSRADSKMLGEAEDIACRVFRAAGVETAWFTANDPAHPGKPEPSRLVIQIYPGHPKRSDIKDAFGMAMTDDNPPASFLADVFLGTIEEVATTRTDETVLLGYVMAHEAGHLLGETHAPDSIMAEAWNARDILRMEAGRVRFSPNQAARVRAAVALRLRIR